MLDMIKNGFQYAFKINRVMRDDTGPRAGFTQFQEYPQNNVQGRGTLVGTNNGCNKYWQVTAPPQVIQVHQPIPADIKHGGTNAGTIYMQPLIDTSSAMG